MFVFNYTFCCLMSPVLAAQKETSIECTEEFSFNRYLHYPNYVLRVIIIMFDSFVELLLSLIDHRWLRLNVDTILFSLSRVIRFFSDMKNRRGKALARLDTNNGPLTTLLYYYL